MTNSLVKMVESLRKASAVDGQQIPVNLSTPQLVGILERLTLALKAPEQKVNSNGGQGFTRLLLVSDSHLLKSRYEVCL